MSNIEESYKYYKGFCYRIHAKALSLADFIKLQRIAENELHIYNNQQTKNKGDYDEM